MIQQVKQIALEAGEIIRDGFGKNISFEYKTNESNLVTEIDKKAEAAIINFIKKEFPDHSILAEESGAEQKESEFTWVIDPLDGTTNFAHGLPIFSVSIGIERGGETIYGVVYDVMRDVCYSAEKGKGAFANDRKITVNDNDNLNHSLLVTGFPYNISENPSGAFEKFVSFLKVARGVRRLGSAAIDFCYVAEGAFDGFWEVSLNPWDVSAGILIVREAGGMVTDFSMKEINSSSIQFLASNGKIHKSMVEILQQS
ncbi:MAG: inositol monophosphatase [Melioribacteraceae bacterium]|nr:inositol monophosphatase [Melioribacteraceae bacterium]MCF8265305.1 inositol monophosphatase [Melioribacteraceae bacterium]MCF8412768.1 inositol monophosphatase [Melioribacteraceae bacterium]